MKKMIFFAICLFAFITLKANEEGLTARVVIENHTSLKFTSGKLFISELNKTIEIHSSKSFNVNLPGNGKYHFGFYSNDFKSSTYYPARITSRKNTVTIRLEKGSDKTTLKSATTPNAGELTDDQIEKGIAKGSLNFILHGLNQNFPEYSAFKKKYGIGFIIENCMVDPQTFKQTSAHNKGLQKYLDKKYGNQWAKDLPVKPFGID